MAIRNLESAQVKAIIGLVVELVDGILAFEQHKNLMSEDDVTLIGRVSSPLEQLREQLKLACFAAGKTRNKQILASPRVTTTLGLLSRALLDLPTLSPLSVSENWIKQASKGITPDLSSHAAELHDLGRLLADDARKAWPNEMWPTYQSLDLQFTGPNGGGNLRRG